MLTVLGMLGLPTPLSAEGGPPSLPVACWCGTGDGGDMRSHCRWRPSLQFPTCDVRHDVLAWIRHNLHQRSRRCAKFEPPEGPVKAEAAGDCLATCDCGHKRDFLGTGHPLWTIFLYHMHRTGSLKGRQGVFRRSPGREPDRYDPGGF